MNEAHRLKTAKPGDLFWLGFGKMPGDRPAEQMVVQKNDGRVVELVPVDRPTITPVTIHVDTLP